ncbi:hypothetical protein MMC16_002935 [Acarospora aff. strigata]|nr:hypothetical protein [Acarospora aff. strigata]
MSTPQVDRVSQISSEIIAAMYGQGEDCLSVDTLEAIYRLEQDIVAGLNRAPPRLNLGTQYYDAPEVVPRVKDLQLVRERCAVYGDPRHWYMQSKVPDHITEEMLGELQAWFTRARLSFAEAADESEMSATPGRKPWCEMGIERTSRSEAEVVAGEGKVPEEAVIWWTSLGSSSCRTSLSKTQEL